MIQGGPNEPRKFNQENTKAKICRKNGRARAGGRENRSGRSMQARKHCTSPTFPVEAEIYPKRSGRTSRDQTRAEGQRRSQAYRTENGNRATVTSTAGDFNRTAGHEEKESLGLEGPLYGRHLTKAQREELMAFIDAANISQSIEAICDALELHPRAYYRWKAGALSSKHGGGGGKNRITPLEEKRVVALAKKNPDWHCRRIAYQLEKTAKVFIGKTKVAEIMKAHGLNHPFEKKWPNKQIEPGDMLLHEPWRRNLLWGMDWTWVNVNDKFMFLLVLLDWYSRKILSWGLYHQITQLEVVSVVTDAVATERIDLLPASELRPIVVADHGSANASKYTKANIEIQGLKLWLSGIGRPTGNARTERLIGTLKREEINLQEQYSNETEAKTGISNAIQDYNFNRPNQGNGGFAPNSVHHMGRKELTERRDRARQKAQELRRKHWEQESTPSNSSLT
jgi:putative transposase